jgi:hypothetical protein
MSFNFSPKIVKDGLVLYLDAANNKSYVSGSTTWSDISTGLNDGTLVNGPTFSSTNYGNIIFDGVNDYTSFLTNPNLYFSGTSPYTLSVFANIVTQPPINVFSGFINREYGSPRNGYNLWFCRDTNPLMTSIASERFGVGSGQRLTFVTLNNSDCIGVWNQYTVTYDGTTLRFYLNGEFKHSALASGNITNTTGTLEIGRRQTDYGNCRISSTLIYNKALSQSEVSQNYNTLKTRFRL